MLYLIGKANSEYKSGQLKTAEFSVACDRFVLEDYGVIHSAMRREFIEGCTVGVYDAAGLMRIVIARKDGERDAYGFYSADISEAVKILKCRLLNRIPSAYDSACGLGAYPRA